jgi:hypothetical protein
VFSFIHSGRFWMFFWVAIICATAIWGILTMLLWRNSVANLNALSIAALLLACGAGIQSSLTMRKADDKDHF